MLNGQTGSRPVAIDLFCGAGGMSLGFEQAGFDVLAAVDNDPIHLSVHDLNFPLTESLLADLSTIDPTDVLGAARRGWSRFNRVDEWPGEIDCIFGGPSCQGFSTMGRHDPTDSRNELLESFVRIVGALRPKYFVIENVPGLLAERHSGTKDQLTRKIEECGYRLSTDHPIRLNAADYGVPQDRRRVFLVGARADQSVPKVPAVRPRVTVGEAIGDLPNIEAFDELFRGDELRLSTGALAALESRSSAYSKFLRAPTIDLGYGREWDPKLLTGCGRTKHSKEVAESFQILSAGERHPRTRTERLDANAQSSTLRAGSGPDRGSFTAPRPIHPTQARVITVREASRLHSYPDWFDVHQTKWHGLRQIGNSVPPRLAHAVAATVVGAIGVVLEGPSAVLTKGDNRLRCVTDREARLMRTGQ